MLEQYRNIFISHIHEDDGRLGALKSLLSEQGFEVRDGSINSDKPNDAKNPDYIMNSILRPRIEWASVLVVLISPDTKDSDWVNKEIECAERLGKRIVGVWDHGEADCEVPEAFKAFGDALVGWQGEKIIDALNGNINNWETPNGEEMPERPIPRYSC